MIKRGKQKPQKKIKVTDSRTEQLELSGHIIQREEILSPSQPIMNIGNIGDSKHNHCKAVKSQFCFH